LILITFQLVAGFVAVFELGGRFGQRFGRFGQFVAQFGHVLLQAGVLRFRTLSTPNINFPE